jgi:hypothetical protein
MNLRLKQSRHLRLKGIFGAINLKLKGRCQCCGTADSYESPGDCLRCAEGMLYKWLSRRSEKKSCAWEGFQELLKVFPLARPDLRGADAARLPPTRPSNKLPKTDLLVKLRRYT